MKAVVKYTDAPGRNFGYSPGDRVTSEIHAEYCGRCSLCRTNNYPFYRE